MTKFKKLDSNSLRNIRLSRSTCGISFDKYARSSNPQDFTDTELAEMYHGYYYDTKILLSDDDTFIDLSKVKSAYCILEDVTYVKKPNLSDDYLVRNFDRISNIRTFYIKGYFLVTNEPDDQGYNIREVTNRLMKAGAYSMGRNNFRGLYRLSNKYVAMQKFEKGWFPKDLFYPIKHFINGPFFNDEYRIRDFYVEGIQIRKEKETV